MRKSLLAISTIASTVVLTSALPQTARAAIGSTQTRSAKEAEFAKALDQFVASLRTSPFAVPGTVVVAVQGDRTLFEKAYGVRDLATGAPMTLDTPVYNASVTKAYTGLLAAMLDAEGKLPLTATIKDVWPQISLPAPLDASAVTVAQLLSHSSGIRAGGLNHRSVWTGDIRMADVPDHLARYATPQRPGFVYDNLGPFVWSAMAEERTGMSWRDHLRRRIIEPLGLRNTSTRLEDFAQDQLVRCHPRIAGEWRPVPPKATAVLNAAGGMYASARDEATFLKAFITEGRSAGGLIPAPLLRRTWQKVAGQDNSMWGLHRDGYGLGWDLGTINGHRFVSRSGGYPGCRSMSMFFPASGFGIVLNSNGDAAANTLHATIAGHAIDLWIDPGLAQAKAAERVASVHKIMAEAAAASEKVDARIAGSKAADSSKWREALGRYRSERLGDIIVQAADGGLEVIAGVSNTAVRHLEADRFVALDDFGASADDFAFIRDASGRIVALMWDDDRYERI